jgi:hypothetical protein
MPGPKKIMQGSYLNSVLRWLTNALQLPFIVFPLLFLFFHKTNETEIVSEIIEIMISHEK